MMFRLLMVLWWITINFRKSHTTEIVNKRCYKSFILCLCGAIPAPLLWGDWSVISPSNRAEHLLIHRIQSHTNPKRRKVFLKQAGQKSVKEELPEQRKGPKRAIEFRLKVQTHIWVQETGRSSRPTRTKIPLKSWISEGFFLFLVYCGAGGENGKRIITNTGTHSHFLVEKGEYLWYYWKKFVTLTSFKCFGI